MVFDSETPNGLPLGVFTADSEGQRIDCPGSSMQVCMALLIKNV